MQRQQISALVCTFFALVSVLLSAQYLNRKYDTLILSELSSTGLHDPKGNRTLVHSPVPRTSGFIPKIVHQEWKSKELTPNFKAWREECIQLNPDWEFRVWTDDENLKLVEDYYPELLELYNGYDKPIKRIDMIRFLYLHRYGGVYMDLDILCLKPFGKFFNQYYDEYIVVNEYRNKVALANAFMASSPGHAIFDDIFAQLPRHKDEIVFDATGGPFLQKYVLPVTSAKWVMLPMVLFYGQEWTQGLKNKRSYDMCESVEDCKSRYPHTITCSMWTGVWVAGDDTKRVWYNSNSNATEEGRRGR